MGPLGLVETNSTMTLCPLPQIRVAVLLPLGLDAFEDVAEPVGAQDEVDEARVRRCRRGRWASRRRRAGARRVTLGDVARLALSGGGERQGDAGGPVAVFLVLRHFQRHRWNRPPGTVPRRPAASWRAAVMSAASWSLIIIQNPEPLAGSLEARHPPRPERAKDKDAEPFILCPASPAGIEVASLGEPEGFLHPQNSTEGWASGRGRVRAGRAGRRSHSRTWAKPMFQTRRRGRKRTKLVLCHGGVAALLRRRGSRPRSAYRWRGGWRTTAGRSAPTRRHRKRAGGAARDPAPGRPRRRWPRRPPPDRSGENAQNAPTKTSRNSDRPTNKFVPQRGWTRGMARTYSGVSGAVRSTQWTTLMLGGVGAGHRDQAQAARRSAGSAARTAVPSQPGPHGGAVSRAHPPTP